MAEKTEEILGDIRFTHVSKTPKILIFDWYSPLFLLIFLVHIEKATLAISCLGIALLWLLRYFGFTYPMLGRKIRSIISLTSSKRIRSKRRIKHA